MLEKFPTIVAMLAGVAERFCTALDCVDTGFIGDGVLDELPTGSMLGRHPRRRGRSQQGPHA